MFAGLNHYAKNIVNFAKRLLSPTSIFTSHVGSRWFGRSLDMHQLLLAGKTPSFKQRGHHICCHCLLLVYYSDCKNSLYYDIWSASQRKGKISLNV